MRAWLVLAALAACSKAHPTRPATRERAALLREVTAFAKRGALPRAGDADYVWPPDDGELAWIHDRAQPLPARLDDALDLTDQLRALMHAYSDRDVRDGQAHPEIARDSIESLAWGEAAVRAGANLDDALIDEFLPTLSPSDPSYTTRLGGLAKAGQGQLGMLQGTLVTLHARRAELAARQSLLAAWRDHVASFRKLWSPEDCTKAQAWVGEVVTSEDDASLKHALEDFTGQLRDCRGKAP